MRGPIAVVLGCALSLVLVVCAALQLEGKAEDQELLARLAVFSPLPPVPSDPTNHVADDPRAARLGHWLFFDTRLSSNGEVSCATCHDPLNNFTDGKPVATAIGTGTRKTPSIVGAAHMRWLFWDGRADSLWAQALEPIENPIEMGFDRLAVAHLVTSDVELREAYEGLFGPLPDLSDSGRFPAHARPVPDEPQHAQQVAWAGMAPADRDTVDRLYANLGKALAAYERQLVRGDSLFDRFVAGDRRALSPAARRGLDLFLGSARCFLCHSGPNFSDSEFHNTSAPGPVDDSGRHDGARKLAANTFHAAGLHSDEREGPQADRVRRLRQSTETWGEFRTPSLRNLSGRAPFMHAGQLPDLPAVLRFYSTREGASGRSHHQEQILLPLELGTNDLAALSAFLESLEGRALEPSLLAPPTSPAYR
jgi:cytochrome c peroxidase